MKKIFEILQLWFLSSLVASFFTIFGSVFFVLGLAHIFAFHDLLFFRGEEGFLIGFSIASAAALFACIFLLLPYVLLRGFEDDLNYLSFAPWLVGLPACLFALASIGSGQPLVYLMAVAALIFGTSGGWIFARTFQFLHYRILDANNKGFFDDNFSIQSKPIES